MAALRMRWTGGLILVGVISGLLLHFVSMAKGFPQEVMLIFWPANYIWQEIQSDFQRELARRIAGNVAVFGALAGLQWGVVGLIIDIYAALRRISLGHRVSSLRRGKIVTDLAFQRRVAEILRKYDPVGRAKADAGQDAYQAETKSILANVSSMRSVRKLEGFCREEFSRRFGRREAKGFSKYKPLAEEIWLAYQQQQSAERRTPPTSEGL